MMFEWLRRPAALSIAIRELEGRLNLASEPLPWEAFRREIRNLIELYRPMGRDRIRVLKLHSRLMQEMERRSAGYPRQLRYIRRCRSADSLGFLIGEFQQYRLAVDQRYLAALFRREIGSGRLRADLLPEFVAEMEATEAESPKVPDGEPATPR